MSTTWTRLSLVFGPLMPSSVFSRHYCPLCLQAASLVRPNGSAAGLPFGRTSLVRAQARLALGLLAGLLILGPASSDVIELKDGGKVEGTLERIVLEEGGKPLLGETIEKMKTIELRDDKDRIHLEGGEVLSGRIQAIWIQSIGGRQKFTRDQIARCERKSSISEDLMQELRKRQQALQPKDAEAHYQLAVWARAAKLIREASKLFQKSLEINPDHPFAEQAHLALGHKKMDGKWTADAAKERPESKIPNPQTQNPNSQSQGKSGGSDASPELAESLTMVGIIESALKTEIEDDISRESLEAEKEASRIKDAISSGEEAKSALQNSLAVERLTGDERKEKLAGIEQLNKESEKLGQELKSAENSLARQRSKLLSQAANKKKELKNAAMDLARRIRSGEGIPREEIEGILRKEADLGGGNKTTTERIAKMKEELETGAGDGGGGAPRKKGEVTADKVKEKQEREAKLQRDMDALNTRIQKMYDEAEREHPEKVEFVIVEDKATGAIYFSDGGKQWRERTKKCQELAQKCLELVKIKIAAIKKNREFFESEMAPTEKTFNELNTLVKWLETHRKESAPPSQFNR